MNFPSVSPRTFRKFVVLLLIYCLVLPQVILGAARPVNHRLPVNQRLLDSQPVSAKAYVAPTTVAPAAPAAMASQGPPVPELLYYKFDGTGTSVPNLASAPPSGTTNATLVGGLTQGGTNLCSGNGGSLIGTGASSTNDYLNTGWAPNLANTSWTISFKTSNIISTTTTYYILGDINTSSFRCFTGGVAGAGNWILRGGGLTDVTVTGGASVSTATTTFVYDSVANNVKAYLNGVLVNTVAQTSPNLTGAGPFKVGGYSSSNGLAPNGQMDEFGLYNRALTAQEVLSLHQSCASTNSSPTITPGSALTAQQSGAASNATIATVSDTETAVGSLIVTATTIPTGITVSNIVNTNGTITADVAAGCTATAGANTVVLTVTDGGSLTATANLTVNVASSAVGISVPPATQTVTVGNSVTFSVTASNAVSYQWRKGTQNIPNANGSSYTINPVGTGDAGSYDVVVTGVCGSATSDAATLTVNKADQAITFGTLASKTWGDAPFAVSATASSNLPISFSVVSGPATISNNTVTLTGAGTVTIRAAQAGDTSYNEATSVEQSFTVNKATVTVTAENKTKVYGTGNPSLTYTYAGFVNNETVSVLTGTPNLSTTATDGSGVGSYPITPVIGSLSASNYQFSFVNGALDISKAALTVKTDDVAKSYGAALPTFTASFIGFMNAESASVLGGALQFSTNATQNSAVGSYSVTPSGLTSENYDITFQPGMLNITTLTLKVKAEDKTKVYGSANPAFTVSYNGFISGEDQSVLGGALAFTTAATSSSNVGNYSITPSGLTSSNYAIQFVDGTLGVTPAPLTVKAESHTRVYGTMNPVLTASFAGLVNGDTMNLTAGTAEITTPALPHSPAGSYPIYVSGVNNPNYDVTYVNGMLTVTPGQPALSLTANPVSSVLGQTVTFTASAAATARYGGVPGGTITFTLDGKSLSPFVLNAAGQASYTISTLALGSHTITASYSGDNNYQSGSKELAQEVNKATSFTTLTTTANPISTGQRLTLTAKVKGSANQPQGQVEFFDGEQSLGKATLTNGVASFTVNELTEGAHALKAVYLGDETSNGSTSTVLTQQVTTDCIFTLSQKEFLIEPQGGKLVVKLDTRGGCSWTVGLPPSWIEVWSPEIINGQWVTTLVVAPQTEPKIRVAKIRFADQEVTITQSRPMTTVQAASYDGQSLAGDTIASIFGTGLASGVESARSQPLPSQLGGVRVKVRDSQGKEQWASLLYVSETQINFLVPSDLAEGELMVTVVKDEVETSAGNFLLETVAPGLFAADASGTGLAAGQIQRVKPDGSQSFAPTAEYNPMTKLFDYHPINMNTSTSLASDEVYLVLFGTGWRNRSSLQNVRAFVGGQEAQVVYAGAQPEYAGLDQANILLPQSLTGAGLVNVVLYVDGKASNTVKIFIQ
ncbi:MAG: Ig-like domain repeat protein [Acidobacteria bacterium]|nr:Ig-like domain repeat protein [Acidobacteriota bacterium]